MELADEIAEMLFADVAWRENDRMWCVDDGFDKKDTASRIAVKLEPMKNALQELLACDGGPGADWDALKYGPAREKAVASLAKLV